MAARRCVDCDLNVPLSVTGECSICGNHLLYFAALHPSADWEERYRAQEPANRAKASNGVHPDDDSATLVYRDDMDAVLVQDTELRRLGYLPEAWDVVRLNGKYYELCDYESVSKFWTIELLDFYQWATQAILDLPEYDGPSSDDIVAMFGEDGKQVYFNPNAIQEDEDAA